MTTRPLPIYNTLTWQEKTVSILVSMLFVLQPFEEFDQRVAVFALAFIGVLILILNKIYCSTGFKQFTFCFGLLCIPGILSIFNTHDIGETTWFILGVPVFFLTGVSIYSLLSNARAKNIVVCIIVCTSIFWLFDSCLQYFSGYDVFGVPLVVAKWGDIEKIKVTGPFIGSAHMGTLLTITLPVVLVCLRRYGKVVILIYVSLLAFIIILTGKRTEWITFILALFFYLLCDRRVWKWGFFLVIPTLLISSTIAISTSPFIQKRFNQFISIPSDYEGWNSKLSGRINLYETGLNMGIKNPITGVGVKAFESAYPDYRVRGYRFKTKTPWTLHAHHPWIAVFAETGFVGVLFLVGLVVFMFTLTSRSIRRLDLRCYPWFISFLLLLNPINSMPPLFKTWWIPIVLLVIIAHITDVEQENKKFTFID